jgi:hypothetical protein
MDSVASMDMLEYLLKHMGREGLIAAILPSDAEKEILSTQHQQDEIFRNTFPKINQKLFVQCIHGYCTLNFLLSLLKDERERTPLDAPTVLDILNISDFSEVNCIRRLLEVFHVKLHDTLVNERGETAVFLACKRQNLGLLRFLVEELQLSPHIPNHDGITPFMIACQQQDSHGTVEVQRYLHTVHHVDVNAVDKLGETALMKVRGSCCYRVIPFLMTEMKVNPYIKNQAGKMAYESPHFEVNREIIKALQSMGMEIPIKPT